MTLFFIGNEREKCERPLTLLFAVDECPHDSEKTEPGACGCGYPDTDSDYDGTPDCNGAWPEVKRFQGPDNQDKELLVQRGLRQKIRFSESRLHQDYISSRRDHYSKASDSSNLEEQRHSRAPRIKIGRPGSYVEGLIQIVCFSEDCASGLHVKCTGWLLVN